MEKVTRSDPLALLDKSTEALVEEMAEAMDAKLVARTLKKIGDRLLKRHPVTEMSDYKGMYDYSGHSARVGRAIHLLLSGVRKEDIVKAGRWKTDAMFERYTKKYDANSGHLAEIRNGEDIAWQMNHA
ncbi:hypothetical protein VIBNISOn1_p0231 [Vibrio nigripulchritudo SOn1]|uniref:Integrase n=1 Tax=Vibrio nigripulchritudo SOn1 TaxID=1238450 RepID=A0AAV2W253_9VIBR|nr:hypothetical protein [Vibrio nigripulchritudo]CCO50393.1 hypothetical protein VIBNISOn1_p0231 [Vibrio nigripulchritudo SOn1]